MNQRHHPSRTSVIALFVVLASACSTPTNTVDHSSHQHVTPLPSLSTGDGGAPIPDIPEPTSYARWSDASTWPSGHVPAAGEDVTIPSGVDVLLDVSPPALGGLEIDGTLTFEDTQDLSLSAKYVMVMGRLRIGTQEAPFTHRATLTLTATDTAESIHGMGTRGVLVMGLLEIFGTPPALSWTRLGDHAAAGATGLALSEAVDWRAGDRIAIAPTDFRSASTTEVKTLTRVDGASLTIDSGLATARFGQLQTIQGRTLDERAEVANLSRNIVIQGADDALWSGQGFGAQVMVMQGAAARIDGLELRRVGQAGKLGRYPLHFHSMSYNDDGSLAGDVNASFAAHVAVSGSANRCVVIHGTNGLLLRDDVCHDIRGHAFFMEDGVERRNVLENNLALFVRHPNTGNVLLAHEGPTFQGGASGFWITNPDNTLRGNVAADAVGNGFWLSFSTRIFGLHANVPLQPGYMVFGLFEDNVAHSNGELGLNIDWVTVDEAGNVQPNKYQPYVNGTIGAESDRRDAVLSRLTSYKNGTGAQWNRVERLRLRDFVVADNPDTMFRGSSTNCTISGALVVGTSGNVGTAPSIPPSGAASYHSQCDIVDNTFVNLPFVAGRNSGAFRTDDYYARPVDKGLVRNARNVFVNTHPGFRTPFPGPTEGFARAGALWDPNGLWGPAGNYWVYDTPFYTTGTSCQQVNPAGQNGQSCAGPYYGVSGFYLDDSGSRYDPRMPIEVTRTDAGNAVISITDGNTAPVLGMMRHFAMVKGGTYVLRFPSRAAPTRIEILVENLTSASDYAMLAIPFDGATAPRVLSSTWPNLNEVRAISPTDGRYRLVRQYVAAASIDAVANGDGTLYYRDAANGLIWLRVQGGLPFYIDQPTPGSDADIYRAMGIRIEPAN